VRGSPSWSLRPRPCTCAALRPERCSRTRVWVHVRAASSITPSRDKFTPAGEGQGSIPPRRLGCRQGGCQRRHASSHSPGAARRRRLEADAALAGWVRMRRNVQKCSPTCACWGAEGACRRWTRELRRLAHSSTRAARQHETTCGKSGRGRGRSSRRASAPCRNPFDRRGMNVPARIPPSPPVPCRRSGVKHRCPRRLSVTSLTSRTGTRMPCGPLAHRCCTGRAETSLL
jgi:hypothetical protein